MVETKPTFSLCPECQEIASLVEGPSKRALFCGRCKSALETELASILRGVRESGEAEAFELREIQGVRARVASWFVGERGGPIFRIRD